MELEKLSDSEIEKMEYDLAKERYIRILKKHKIEESAIIYVLLSNGMLNRCYVDYNKGQEAIEKIKKINPESKNQLIPVKLLI